MNSFYKLTLIAISVILFLFTSCASFSIEELKELTEDELFTRAQLSQQQAISETDYKNTIATYEYYTQTFTDRPDRSMEARYEIAYIHYYLEEYDIAEQIFRALIHEYENGANEYTPQWIFVLATKLKDKIVKMRTEEILEASQQLEE